jgi:hypothetical protein
VCFIFSKFWQRQQESSEDFQLGIFLIAANAGPVSSSVTPATKPGIESSSRNVPGNFILRLYYLFPLVAGSDY